MPFPEIPHVFGHKENDTCHVLSTFSFAQHYSSYLIMVLQDSKIPRTITNKNTVKNNNVKADTHGKGMHNAKPNLGIIDNKKRFEVAIETFSIKLLAE